MITVYFYAEDIIIDDVTVDQIAMTDQSITLIFPSGEVETIPKTEQDTWYWRDHRCTSIEIILGALREL